MFEVLGDKSDVLSWRIDGVVARGGKVFGDCFCVALGYLMGMRSNAKR